MKKLKKQIFLLVFLILTVVTTSVFAVYNVQLYSQSKRSVERSLNQTMKIGLGDFDIFVKPPESENAPSKYDNFGNVRFMDTTVFTIILDEDNMPETVINHSDLSLDECDTAALCEKIVANGKTEKIGLLYTSRYSYKFENQSYITVVDNEATNKFLSETLIITFFLYLALELIFAFIAKRITNRISRPVAESFEKQKQFIADASHELKTPLAVIMASSEALESNPTERKWLDNIKSESDRMNKLIADLLDLAKSDAVDDKAQFAVSSLSKAVEKSVLTFEGVMFENGIMLEDSIEEGIELNMDEFKIQQLMSILLDNAVKHSAKGGTINVVLKREKDIILTVTNEGEGIPEGEEQKIFERFYRADESRNRNENRYGLGLAIAKNICLSHGGEISAHSSNGKTTFKVVFKG